MEETWIEVGLEGLYLEKSMSFSLKSATIFKKTEYEWLFINNEEITMKIHLWKVTSEQTTFKTLLGQLLAFRNKKHPFLLL